MRGLPKVLVMSLLWYSVEKMELVIYSLSAGEKRDDEVYLVALLCYEVLATVVIVTSN